MIAQFAHKLGFINVEKICEADTVCNGTAWGFYAVGFYRQGGVYKDCYLWLYSADMLQFANIQQLEIEGVKDSLGEVTFISYPGNFLDKKFYQQLNDSVCEFLTK